MAIKPIGKNIIFVFKDKVNSKGEFERGSTASGIVLLGGHEDSAKQSRWGVVIAVGPDVKDATPGQEILLPALRWTNSISVGDQKFWKTDENEVVAIRKNADAELKAIGQFVVFEAKARKAVKSQTIIVPTRDLDAPAEGVFVSKGPKASDELAPGVTIYYNDANFENFLVHKGKGFAFIKDEEIFAYSVE